MLLLPKSQVIAKKNEEDRVAMKQGLELANRVDGLRKQNLEEEKKMTTNRQLMLSEIRTELETLRLDCESKKAEIKRLEEDRIRLLKPLDDEWNALRVEQATWNEKLANLQMELETIRLKEIEVQEQFDTANDNIQKSLELKREAEIIKAKSEHQSNEIKRLSDNLSWNIQIHARNIATSETKLSEREAQLNRKAEELKNKEQNLNLKEREFYLTNVRNRPK